MIGPVGRSAAGLLNEGRTQEVLGFLSWIVDDTFLCTVGHTPKKIYLSKLIITDIDKVIYLSAFGTHVDNWTLYSLPNGWRIDTHPT